LYKYLNQAEATKQKQKMKARPRQIDNSKSFYAIESFEKFKQEEGQDNDLAVTQSIITPILLDASKEM
jgi:nicotinic acid mononucleotide adenylyltransferase